MIVQSESCQIMLIDDDEEDYIITHSLLRTVQGKRCELHWKPDVEEALALLNDYDIFLVDYRIGPINGIDVIKQISKMRPEAPVILLTGLSDAQIDIEAMKAGAYDYLVKGKIDAEMLERSIRYAMEHASHLKQIKTLNQQLELRVEEQTQQLTATQKILMAIAQNYPNGVICTYNCDLICEFIEGKALSVHNLVHDDFIGKTVFETFGNDQATIHDTHFRKTLQGENTTYEVHFDSVIYLINTTPIKNNVGHIERILVVVINITPIKLAEEKMKLALDKANELNDLKSRFVSTASHEFRTPLSTILSSTNLIQRYYTLKDDNQFIRHTHKIKSAITNLTEILEDFLSVEKLDQGHIKVLASPINIADFVQGIIEDLRDTLKQGQVLHYSCSNSNIKAMQDKKLLRAIIQNLISNAIKYTPADGNIDVKLALDSEKLKLTVKDNGIGIPNHEQQYLFERFYRANNAANIEGTGIGLNIVKKYIELLEGDIIFESTPNIGTTFFVELPLNLIQEK
jgi:signal transduction histidine kinase/FixJ family two-component response regulator